MRRAVLLLLALIAYSDAFAQSAADVLRSFRKLEADTVAGMTVNQYARGMAEVSAQLKSFSDANQGKPTPETIRVLSLALAQYQKARDVMDQEYLWDMRYADNELPIKTYFDRKRDMAREIDGYFRAASAEIDRAARAPRK
jgi:hypothetical protein